MKKVNGNIMKNTIAILGIAAFTVSAAPELRAGHVSFSFGGSLRLPVPVFSVPVCEAPPVVVQTVPMIYAAPLAPVARYYVPPPAVFCAPPVLVAPRVFYAPPAYYRMPEFGFNFRFGPRFHAHYRH